jgi:DNA polymerase-3 subunit alpha
MALGNAATYNAYMFVHLRLHTEFSVVDGTTRVDEVAQLAAADGQPALAIADLNNFFATVKFYRACRAQGVKPLIGAEVLVEGFAVHRDFLRLIYAEHARKRLMTF